MVLSLPACFQTTGPREVYIKHLLQLVYKTGNVEFCFSMFTACISLTLEYGYLTTEIMIILSQSEDEWKHSIHVEQIFHSTVVT